jgi:hypothetical protein
MNSLLHDFSPSVQARIIRGWQKFMIRAQVFIVKLDEGLTVSIASRARAGGLIDKARGAC